MALPSAHGYRHRMAAGEAWVGETEMSVGSTSILPDLLAYQEWLGTIDQTAKTAEVLAKFITAIIQKTGPQDAEAVPVPWSSVSKELIIKDINGPETALRKVVLPETFERWIKGRQAGYLQYCASKSVSPLRFKVIEGRPKHYTFERIPKDEYENIDQPWLTCDSVLRWRRMPLQQDEMGPIGRLLYPNNRHEISGWRHTLHYVQVGIMAILFAFLLICAYIMLIAMQIGSSAVRLGTLVSLGTQILLLFLYFRFIMVPTARSADMRTHPANPLLVNFKDGIWVDRINANLGRHKSDPAYNESMKAFRQLVRWQADCPICGSVIELKTDSIVAKGELVGCCVESPDEHSFSFDRVTLEGRALRASPTRSS